MKIAVGVDIVEISRIKRLILEHPDAELEIFTETERQYCAGKKNRYAHLAARFAAKEAVLKALATGLGPGHAWTDVEVRGDPLGRPHVVLYGLAAARVTALRGQLDISISHTAAHAIAHAAVLFSADFGTADQDSPPTEEPKCAST